VEGAVAWLQQTARPLAPLGAVPGRTYADDQKLRALIAAFAQRLHANAGGAQKASS
jgi:hypothetical protein